MCPKFYDESESSSKRTPGRSGTRRGQPRPYKCEECGKRFGQESKLRTHMEEHQPTVETVPGNDLTIGCQNLNPLSHPNATLNTTSKAKW